MKKKIVLMTAGLACLCLSGCGKQPVQELIGNYDGCVPRSIEMEYGIENIVSVSIKADISEDAAHGNMAVAGVMPKAAEFYRDGPFSYVYDTDLEYWTVSEDGTVTDMSFLFDELNPELFPNEKVKYDKKAGAYIIKQPFEDFSSTQDYADMTSLLGEMGIAAGGSSDDAYVSYAFDKEGTLISVTADAPIKLDIKLMSFDGSIETPEGVRESAVYSDYSISFEDVYDAMAGSASGTVPGSSGTASSIDPGFIINYEGNVDPGMATGGTGYENIDPGILIHSDTGEATAYYDGQYAGYGEYESNGLSDAGNEWAATFGDSGWGFTTEDYTETYLKAENPQYPGAVFTVYGADTNSETSAYEIIKYGFYNYDIDCHGAEEYPPFSWNGVTFGASANDIENAYGEPDVVYDGDRETAYRYFLEHGEILFFIREGRGLDRVTFSR